MYIRKALVKTVAFCLCLGLYAFAARGGEKVEATPHMIYFYNPGCRLCTKTNETVAAAEEKYQGVMSHERRNTADPKTGVDNVLYMFELMDELEVPDDVDIKLVVFIGISDPANKKKPFTPQRVLIEGDEIIEKLDTEITDFLASRTKGEELGMVTRPAGFFSANALASLILPARETGYAAEETVVSEPEPQVKTVDGGEPVAIEPDPDEESRSEERKETAKEEEEKQESEKAPSGRQVAWAEGQLKFWTISGAALADSVNPCAFATIIILVAMMSTAKRTKREIIAVCLTFTLSVFLTYFAIGLVLHQVIKNLQSGGGWFLVAADIVYYLAFLLCVVCGILSLRDAYLMHKGYSAEEMALKLPKAFKKRINLAMAKGVRSSILVVGVFVAGVSVSFLEAACTGQVYLPTVFLFAQADFWRSVRILLWYNFLFVSPLLIIFGLVLVGMTSEQLAAFFKNNVKWTRLALGIVFIVMGAIILNEMYWPPGYRG